jgi:hypothetical protein
VRRRSLRPPRPTSDHLCLSSRPCAPLSVLRGAGWGPKRTDVPGGPSARSEVCAFACGLARLGGQGCYDRVNLIGNRVLFGASDGGAVGGRTAGWGHEGETDRPPRESLSAPRGLYVCVRAGALGRTGLLRPGQLDRKLCPFWCCPRRRKWVQLSTLAIADPATGGRPVASGLSAGFRGRCGSSSAAWPRPGR